MQNNKLDIKTTNGQVIKENCGCCLNISFKNILWSIHINTFYSLNKYIKDLLEFKYIDGNLSKKKILLGMEGISMMVWINLVELEELSQLLEMTFIELKRNELENNYEKESYKSK
jgi:hypothetical protein